MTDIQKQLGMSSELAEYKEKLKLVQKMIHSQEQEALVRELRKELANYKTNCDIMRFAETSKKQTVTQHEDGTVAVVESVFKGGKPKFKYTQIKTKYVRMAQEKKKQMMAEQEAKQLTQQKKYSKKRQQEE